MSLAALCREAGCDYTYLWRIIHADEARGRRYTRPSYDLTRKLGLALGAIRETLARAGYGEYETAELAREADEREQHARDLEKVATLAEPLDSARLEVRGIPVLGHVRAGDLHEALENPEEHLDVPAVLLGNPEFLLRVCGDSMAPTLLDGDLVGIRSHTTAECGQLVVANVNDEITLKRYDVVDGVPSLVPDNPEWRTMPCGPHARIAGVVTGSFRPPDVLRRRPR